VPVPPSVPEPLIRATIEWRGDAGAEWLKGIPAFVADLQRRKTFVQRRSKALTQMRSWIRRPFWYLPALQVLHAGSIFMMNVVGASVCPEAVIE
jgi:hypothetical protein